VVVATIMGILFAILGVVCWIFWRAASREAAERADEARD